MHNRIIYVLLIEAKQFAILFFFFHSQISNYVVNNQIFCTNNLNLTVYTLMIKDFFSSNFIPCDFRHLLSNTTRYVLIINFEAESKALINFDIYLKLSGFKNVIHRMDRSLIKYLISSV